MGRHSAPRDPFALLAMGSAVNPWSWVVEGASRSSFPGDDVGLAPAVDGRCDSRAPVDARDDRVCRQRVRRGWIVAAPVVLPSAAAPLPSVYVLGPGALAKDGNVNDIKKSNNNVVLDTIDVMATSLRRWSPRSVPCRWCSPVTATCHY